MHLVLPIIQSPENRVFPSLYFTLEPKILSTFSLPQHLTARRIDGPERKYSSASGQFYAIGPVCRNANLPIAVDLPAILSTYPKLQCYRYQVFTIRLTGLQDLFLIFCSAKPAESIPTRRPTPVSFLFRNSKKVLLPV
jgi:hypothetical protein